MIILQLISNKEFELLKLHLRLEVLKTKPKMLKFWHKEEITAICSKVRDLDRELGQLRLLRKCLENSEVVEKHPQPISWLNSDLVGLGFSVVSVKKEGNDFVHKYTLVK